MWQPSSGEVRGTVNDDKLVVPESHHCWIARDFRWRPRLPGTLPAFLVLVDLTPPQPMDGIVPDSSFNASRVIADFFAAHART